MQLKPVTRKSLSDAVFEQLSSEIVHGRMVPGAPLPSERTLCDLLRVNRGAVREALKRLSQAGLITIQHGGGAKVLDYKQSGNLDLLTRLLFRSDGTIDLQVARSAMEMRAAMAPDIARLCARRRQPEHIHQVFELVADNRSMARALFMATHLVNTFLLLAALALTCLLYTSPSPRD